MCWATGKSNVRTNAYSVVIESYICSYPFAAGRSTISLGGDTDSIASDIAPLPNPPVYMPYSGTYNPSHGYQPIQYGCTDRHVSSGKKNFLLYDLYSRDNL